MTLAFLFWLLMILWLIFGLIYPASAAAGAPPYWPRGGHLLLWILLFLIGWQTFGFPIRG